MSNFRPRNRTHFISRQYLGRLLACLIFVLCFCISYFVPFSAQDTLVLAQVNLPCATPGKDGPRNTLTGIINTYYPATTTATVNAGAKSIPVGSPTPTANPAIAAGDLLLVIQMQDADINSTNTDAYGDGISGDVPTFTPGQTPYPDPPSTAASGWTSTNAGKYEFVVATSAVSSGSVSITGLGSGNGLINSYVRSPASTIKGQSTYQVIRVPQFSSATLGNATAMPWNGSIGGILAFDVAGELNLSGTVNVSGRGFRGGGGRRLTGANSPNTDYRTMSTLSKNGSKGEGIAGTPRFVNTTSFDATGNPSATPTVSDNGSEGYPNGSYGRGAPGNAGGGSTDGNSNNNDQNSGGGGGGNGGRGGRGGRAWSSQYPTGGFGGKEFFLVATNRLILGGGGGAGTTNDSSYDISSTNRGTGQHNGAYSSGAAGGGMVIIRTNKTSNTGTILANGADAPNVTQDGGGGGGAGGSVLVFAQQGSLAGLTVSVKGGKGGDANFTSAHGPGGGGGGGVIVTTTPGITVASGGLSGGNAGVTATNPLGVNFRSEAGTGLVATITATNLPGIKSGAECSAQLTVTKTTSTPYIRNQPTGTTATYAIAVSNALNKAAATNVDISDALPTGFTYASTSSISLTGGATQPTTTNPTTGSTNPTWGKFTIPGGGQVQITFVVNVPNTVVKGTYQNSATATYLDPARTTTTGTTSAIYDSASSKNDDVYVGNPKLLLVKRITRINAEDINDIVDGRSNVSVTDPNYVDAAYAADDNAPTWPANYLRGAIKKNNVRPSDEVEYTVYFLSNGDTSITNVSICDLVPDRTTFIPTTFNGKTPTDGGLAGADSGIALALGSTQPTAYLTNVRDSDRAEFLPAGTTLPAACSNGSQNANGAVIVNVVSKNTPATTPPNANEILPNATAAGTPATSYGFIRFRVRVI